MSSNIPNSLCSISRRVLNRNIPIENIENLPLPNILKDECYRNVTIDRFGKKSTKEPCSCSFFDSDKYKSMYNVIHEFNPFEEEYYQLHFLYKTLWPSNANWLRLPNKSLFNPLQFSHESGLGQVHTWINRYLYYEMKYGWYHISVSAKSLKKFIDNVKNVVYLPYWCVSFCGYQMSTLNSYKRRMIIVVKDSENFEKTLSEKMSKDQFFNVKIKDLNHLINAIAYVSRPSILCGRFGEINLHPERNLFIGNPMVPHASFWMNLLISNKRVEYLTQKSRGISLHKNENGNLQMSASEELEIQNCVVRFEPNNLCIGDAIKDKSYVRSGNPYVFWLDGQILKVFQHEKCPLNKEEYIKWCISREMNTLLNLNGNSWVTKK